MRNLFLVLLLANLLFLGWRYWVAPAEVPATRLLAAGKEPTLEAPASPGKPAAHRKTAAPSDNGLPVDGQPATADGGQCMRIGPIGEGTLAQNLRDRLARGGLQATTVSEDGQIWVGNWVQLEQVATREEADQAVVRLAAGGLPDAYVLQASPPFAISLGVFRDRARADVVAATAFKLGFRPKITDRFRVGTQFWVSVVLPAGRSLPLDALGQQSGQIFRAEQVACPVAPVGAPATIH